MITVRVERVPREEGVALATRYPISGTYVYCGVRLDPCEWVCNRPSGHSGLHMGTSSFTNTDPRTNPYLWRQVGVLEDEEWP